MVFKDNYTNIKIKIIERVILITLNRPSALNALSSGLIDDLNHALKVAEKNSNISVIVITGSSKAFAAGADIKEMIAKSFSDLIDNDFIKPWEKLSLCKKPTIAAVDGYALGGGCELAMMCDLLIANENTKFGQPEINLGVFPAAGGTQRLPRAVGKAKAMDMVLSGRMMGAEEAEKLGLVSRIISSDNFIENVIEIAKEISEKSLPSLIMAKDAINSSYETSLSQGIIYERRLFRSAFSLEDQKEGMSAFIEKRKAKFKNS
ncbi:MAG: enoyl-CoA hydratase [Pelagibacterales bacterium]|nr:enoyl-CoA hydratase [Pelagibacterales bacterium]PPR15985.1 MAG: putative enoyl-CoA hydratase echA8 [Alphaproteobacteria bacterium MarineAlpha9_Bin3]|tara:strand:+ start:6010 stop:6795 length:786 start_codon:yes stop_codon:yes gene_type:complete